MSAISIKQLLEAGVHFGHQTARWNPKMKPFIFGERNAIHIIDLQKTLRLFKEAVDFLTNVASQGKTVLFVGTKSQAQETIEEEARRCGMYWVTNRWLGGLLTNFSTVQNSIKRYRELETMRDNGFYEKLSKKEVARLERERKKLEKNLRGIRDLEKCPDVIFLVDSNQEFIAVKEAAKLKIPTVAIVDTNCDPDLIDYVIPGNDDALRAVKLFTSTVADAILAGRSVYTARVEAAEKEAQEKAAKEEARRKAAKEAKEAAQEAARQSMEAGSEKAAQQAKLETPQPVEEAVREKVVGDRGLKQPADEPVEEPEKQKKAKPSAAKSPAAAVGKEPVAAAASKKTKVTKAKRTKKATASKKTKASAEEGESKAKKTTKKIKKTARKQKAPSTGTAGAESEVKAEQTGKTEAPTGSSTDAEASDADS